MHNTAHTKYGTIPLVLSTDKDIPHETIPCYGPEKVILNINIVICSKLFQNYKNFFFLATSLGQIFT